MDSGGSNALNKLRIGASVDGLGAALVVAVHPGLGNVLPSKPWDPSKTG